MPYLDKTSLLAGLVPPLDSVLAEQMLDEFVSLEQRFVLREWEPATLDGGQFAEVCARILYHQDSGNLSRRKGVNLCLKYVEDPNNANPHHYQDRKSSLHVAKVIRTIYKFRSDRGAVHIDPTYTANHLDSKLVLENSRWALSELLRVFWTADREQVARVVRELAQYDIPVIGVYDGVPLVQRGDLSTEEEVLVLLHYAGQDGLSRKAIGRSCMKSPASVTRALSSLCSPSRREATKLANGNYRLTDPGIRRVIQSLGGKLTIQ